MVRKTDEVTQRAKAQVGEKAESARERMGEQVVEWTKETFPEQYQAQRRKDAATAFGIGVVVGAVVRSALRR